MLSPGIIVLVAAISVAIQIGVIVWIKRDIRGLEDRMGQRIDALAKTMREQADKETALIRRADDLIALSGRVIQRFDDQELR